MTGVVVVENHAAAASAEGRNYLPDLAEVI